MKAINVWRAVCKRGVPLERLLYEAFLYAEDRITLARIIDLIDEVEILEETNDKIVIDYVIDLLANRCKPL